MVYKDHLDRRIGGNCSGDYDYDKHVDNKIEELRSEYEALCNELEMDEKDAARVFQRRIRLLHEFNDLKDTATMLIGIYAQKTGKTLHQVYEDFNVDSPTTE
ncbi:hypothetical protein BDB00DRAFT_869649 [Zychaea mexicana]|uniref:uncharacterized protein n=1 Tax=Zychaea mexicana TaxID=64656 RepID=UPI0022FED446|nr:uncharacterized protein BDB00DRAFT_869649 [Zychaea mexicana]KAI9496354.1 hypothetical protein BDB00DRAFT_869649 [Zychaea mexicana]